VKKRARQRRRQGSPPPLVQLQGRRRAGRCWGLLQQRPTGRSWGAGATVTACCSAARSGRHREREGRPRLPRFTSSAGQQQADTVPQGGGARRCSSATPAAGPAAGLHSAAGWRCRPLQQRHASSSSARPLARPPAQLLQAPGAPPLHAAAGSGSLHSRFRNSYVLTMAVPQAALLAMRGATPRSRPRGPSCASSCRSVPSQVGGACPACTSMTCAHIRQACSAASRQQARSHRCSDPRDQCQWLCDASQGRPAARGTGQPPPRMPPIPPCPPPSPAAAS